MAPGQPNKKKQRRRDRGGALPPAVADTASSSSSSSAFGCGGGGGEDTSSDAKKKVWSWPDEMSNDRDIASLSDDETYVVCAYCKSSVSEGGGPKNIMSRSGRPFTAERWNAHKLTGTHTDLVMIALKQSKITNFIVPKRDMESTTTASSFSEQSPPPDSRDCPGIKLPGNSIEKRYLQLFSEYGRLDDLPISLEKRSGGDWIIRAHNGSGLNCTRQRSLIVGNKDIGSCKTCSYVLNDKKTIINVKDRIKRMNKIDLVLSILGRGEGELEQAEYQELVNFRRTPMTNTAEKRQDILDD
ncbi:hypothetical protein PsorP6_005160 [Peronosclerospora sorghi]|uniref:Uncharacterized protein n=1 Tax=Peronosclerospora sorghi TaxID=230839 RepID=A0ACC0W3G1_9STRA|nr:hypothetical protein PsorP6_005160 [Peronosclerospora sorghi]